MEKDVLYSKRRHQCRINTAGRYIYMYSSGVYLSFLQYYQVNSYTFYLLHPKSAYDFDETGNQIRHTFL